MKKVFEVSQIKGSVDDRDKAPLANTCIGLFSDDGKKLVAVQGTDAKGKFQFPNVESGSYHVVVRDASKDYRVLSFNLVVSHTANTRRKNRMHIHMSATRGIPSMSVNDHE